MEKTSKEMSQWMQKVAEANEIHYTVEHEQDLDIIRMGFRLDSAISSLDLVIYAEERGFRSFAFIDNTPGKRKPEVAEFLMRANISDFGHFNLDYDNDRIGYEFYVPYNVFEEDDDLAIVWNLPVIRFSIFGDGLLKVILGCATPKEAFEECMKEEESSDADGDQKE